MILIAARMLVKEKVLPGHTLGCVHGERGADADPPTRQGFSLSIRRSACEASQQHRREQPTEAGLRLATPKPEVELNEPFWGFSHTGRPLRCAAGDRSCRYPLIIPVRVRHIHAKCGAFSEKRSAETSSMLSMTFR